MGGFGRWAVLVVILFFNSGCAINDKDRCLDGFYFEDNNCYEENDTETGTGGPGMDGGADGGTGEWGLGKPCTCQGKSCEIMGVPLPAGGTIIGCENVPVWPGAELVCLRSYTGSMSEDNFFANGYCSLMASSCTGDDMICNSGTIGEYAKMVSCPPGSVMLSAIAEMEMSSLKATLSTKYCAPACTRDDECRNDEFDPVFDGAPTQYQCVELDGINFCCDPRNLKEGTTAEAF